MMQEIDEPMAIPLWINGHAYLTMPKTFFDVRNPKTGEILRRIPLCGADAAAKAVDAAHEALAGWGAETVAARAALLVSVGEALEGYADHFAGLLVEETGREAAAAAAEVRAAVALLRAAAATPAAVSGGRAEVVAIVSDDTAPLLGPLSLAVSALLAGSTLVLKPSPKAPSAVFALAELSAQSGFPAGVLNILQGDEAAVEGLCVAAAVSALQFFGDPALGERVGAIAGRYGKPFSA
jgi:succinate-semialdehyde dehydrogenase / glutarate-semialdehyde dehydrogenase